MIKKDDKVLQAFIILEGQGSWETVREYLNELLIQQRKLLGSSDDLHVMLRAQGSVRILEEIVEAPEKAREALSKKRP